MSKPNMPRPGYSRPPSPCGRGGDNRCAASQCLQHNVGEALEAGTQHEGVGVRKERVWVALKAEKADLLRHPSLSGEPFKVAAQRPNGSG